MRFYNVRLHFRLGLIFFLLIGCTNAPDYSKIPEKKNFNSVAVVDSGVTTLTIKNYLFRDDIVDVDLRPYSWVIKDGHIAGFGFFPFYDLIAHRQQSDRLFSMNVVYNENGDKILGGEVGSFTPNYEESTMVINKLFPKDKYIFAISQSGLECCYFLNLLIQLDYDCKKLYNIGGFSISTGFENVAYINIENPTYLVKGNVMISSDINETFNFMQELTPIK